MPKLLLTLFVSVFVLACGGESARSVTDSDTGHACVDGSVTIDGPLVAIMARYPDASPPERLRAHQTSPGLFISVELDGWLRFTTYDHNPIPAGSSATLTATDVATGEKQCPIEILVE